MRAVVVVVVVRFALSAPERACMQARPESALRVLIPLPILPLTGAFALLLLLLALHPTCRRPSRFPQLGKHTRN